MMALPDQPIRFNRDRPLTVEETEELIYSVLDLLEASVEDLAVAMANAAKAEAQYRIEHAREYLLAATQKTGDGKAAQATYNTRELLIKRKDAEAIASAAAERCRVRRAELDALRTIASSARAAQHG